MSTRYHKLMGELAAYRAGQRKGGMPGGRRGYARHEAGHVVVAHGLGLAARGHVAKDDSHTSADTEDPAQLAAIAWGGPIVDGTFGRWSRGDIRELGDELERDTPSESFTIAEQIIAADPAAVDRIAEAFWRRGVLLDQDIVDLLGGR
jgi:hypothetical protein